MKIKLTVPIEEIHGTMADTVFKSGPNGKTILTKKPDMSKVKWSQAQKENRSRMADAIAVTHFALENPRVRARYEHKAKKLGRRVWNLALSDCLLGKDLYANK